MSQGRALGLILNKVVSGVGFRVQPLGFRV